MQMLRRKFHVFIHRGITKLVFRIWTIDVFSSLFIELLLFRTYLEGYRSVLIIISFWYAFYKLQSYFLLHVVHKRPQNYTVSSIKRYPQIFKAHCCFGQALLCANLHPKYWKLCICYVYFIFGFLCLFLMLIWLPNLFFKFHRILTSKGTAVAQWLRFCATNRKDAGSIPAGVSGFFMDIKSFRLHYGPRVESASNRHEYQEYFLGVKLAGA